MSEEISISDRIKVISDLVRGMHDTIIAQANGIARLRGALKRIDEEDDTGPMMFEDLGEGRWQPVGGSRGKFSAIARAALEAKP